MILHFLLAFSMPFTAAAQASSFYIKPFSAFTQEANFIVRGTLSNIHSEHGISDSGAKIIYTFANMDVKEVLKGNIAKPSIVIREVGGSKDGYIIDIPGTPELKEGEDTVLFLTAPKSDQSYEIDGLELGQYGIQEKNGQETLTGGIFNYAKHDEHNLAQAEPENQHPWTLKDVRALVEKQGGKDAPVKPASTPMTAAQANAAAAAQANSPAASGSAPMTNPGTETAAQTLKETESTPAPYGILLWASLAVVAAAGLFFLFRKR